MKKPLKSKTTIYRIDGEAYKDDTEAVEVLKTFTYPDHLVHSIQLKDGIKYGR